jgi:predicted helicase
MLITARGSKHIGKIMESQEIKDLINDGVIVYDMSVKFGKRRNNKVEFDKQRYIQKIKDDVNAGHKVIVIQIKMADTGIDIPGLNAMLSFRNFGKITMQQTYGRIARVCDGKEFGYVVIPSISLENLETKQNIKEFINYLRNDVLGYKTFEMFNEDILLGIREDEEPEGLNDNSKKSRVKQTIEELEYKIEDENTASMIFDKVKQLLDKDEEILVDFSL